MTIRHWNKTDKNVWRDCDRKEVTCSVYCHISRNSRLICNLSSYVLLSVWHVINFPFIMREKFDSRNYRGQNLPWYLNDVAIVRLAHLCVSNITAEMTRGILCRPNHVNGQMLMLCLKLIDILTTSSRPLVTSRVRCCSPKRRHSERRERTWRFMRFCSMTAMFGSPIEYWLILVLVSGRLDALPPAPPPPGTLSAAPVRLHLSDLETVSGLTRSRVSRCIHAAHRTINVRSVSLRIHLSERRTALDLRQDSVGDVISVRMRNLEYRLQFVVRLLVRCIPSLSPSSSNSALID